MACLESGGGVVIAKMKSRKERKRAKRALKQAGAVESELGIWKRPKVVFGAALPPQQQQQAESESEEDYGPSLEATRKPATTNNAAQKQSVNADLLVVRGEWMTSNLQATDPRLLLRQKAQTSQKSRSFSNIKGSASISSSGEVDSREVATGRADPSAKLLFTSQNAAEEEEEKPFRFNHAEVMGTGNDVDTSRLRNELQNGIASRFTQSKKYL